MKAKAIGQAAGAICWVGMVGTAHAGGVVSECTQDALEAAIVGGGEVTFACETPVIDITRPLQFGQIEVSINGEQDNGPVRLVASDASPTRLVQVQDTATVTLANLVLSGGRADAGAAAKNFGTLRLNNVNVSGNHADSVGGGIENFGVLEAAGLRIANNSAPVGGGLYNAGLATVTQATFVGNTSGSVGSAIENLGEIRLANATIADNAVGGEAAIRFRTNASASSVLRHVTITGNRLTNSASNASAGLVIDTDARAALFNSVIAGNGPTGQCSIRGTLVQAAGSIASDDRCGAAAVRTPAAINLGPLTPQADGLQTIAAPELPTVLLDAGDEAGCRDGLVAGTDQIGRLRAEADSCDVGAVELDVARPVVDLNGAADGRDVTAGYAENAGSQSLIPEVTVDSGQLATLTAAEARLLGVVEPDDETLAAEAAGTALGVTFDAATSVLRISGEAAATDYAAVLATLQYRYEGEILGDADRRIEVRVEGDSLDSRVSRIELTLEPINDPPTAQPDAYSTPADSVLSVAAPGVLGNDSDPDRQTLTVSGPTTTTGGAGLNLATDGGFVMDPTATYEALGADESVTDGFEYTVDDGAGSTATASVSITIVGVNDPPVAGADRFVLTEDGVVNSPAPGVLANDSDPDADDVLRVLSADATTSSGLPVAISEQGALIFDPRAEPAVQALRQGVVQVETMRYTVSDAAGREATGSVRFEIQGRNDVPTAVSLGQERAFVEQPAVIPLAGAFSDVDEGDVLTYVASGLPASLRLDSTNGNVTGTPRTDEAGRYTVSISAFDEAGASAASSLVLIVEREGNDPPFVVSGIDDRSLDEGESFSVMLSDVFEDPDGDALTFAVDGLPPGIALGDSALSGAPAFDSVGDYAVTVTAADPSGASTDVAFALTVTRPPQDLAVRVEPAVTVAGLNTPFDWTVTVENRGSATAGGALQIALTGAGLTGPVPAGCTRSVGLHQVLLDCPTGAIEVAAQTAFTVPVQADRSGGLWMQAQVGDLANDLVPADNRASAGATVTELLAATPGAEFEVAGGTRLALLDLDGDGALDIAVGTEAGAATRLFIQASATRFEPAGTLGDLGEARALLAGNFDGIDGQDLVVVNAAGGHALYVNNGSGQFVLAPQPLTGDQGLAAQVADLDEDGADDFVIVNADATPTAYFNEGMEGFFATALEPTGAVSVGLGDLDGDGRPEPVFGQPDGDVFQPTIGRRSFGARLALPTAGVTQWVGADLDGDEDQDLVAARPELAGDDRRAPELRVLRSQPRNVVELGARADYGLSRHLAAGDLDSDGDLDVVTASPTGVVQLLVNDGSGRLRPHTTALEADAVDLALRDMDRDGDLDLILLLAQPAVVQIWFNTGELRFSDTAGRPVGVNNNPDADQGSGAWPLSALLPLLLAAWGRWRWTRRREAPQ